MALKNTQLLENGYWSSFPVVKQPGCEVDHLPPYSAKWSYTSTSPICLFGMENSFSFITPKELLVQEIHTTIRMVLTDREK